MALQATFLMLVTLLPLVRTCKIDAYQTMRFVFNSIQWLCLHKVIIDSFRPTTTYIAMKWIIYEHIPSTTINSPSHNSMNGSRPQCLSS